MTPDELRKLKVGDTVYIEAMNQTVTKVGRKFIHITGPSDKILIEKACTYHPMYSQWQRYIFKDQATRDAYNLYCKSIDEVNAYISKGFRLLTADQRIRLKSVIEEMLNEKGA